MQESIYNLLPPEEHVAERPAMYRSKHGGGSGGPAPSYSTFPHKATQSVMADSTASRSFARPAANMGRTVGGDINPKQFLLAHEKHPPLPEVKKINRPQLQPLRAPVPTRDEQPVMGLKTDKNFVTSNAVEVICTQPKCLPEPKALAVHRPSFGKVPKYLHGVKAALHEEQQMVVDYHASQRQQQADAKAQYVNEMSPEEKSDMLQRLTALQAEKGKALQSMPFGRDTMSQRNRKEGLERDLKTIEEAIAKLSKEVVVIYRDDPSCKDWCQQLARREAEETALARRSR